MNAARTLQTAKTLVLNADYQPLSYDPLSLWDWHDVAEMLYKEKVEVVAEYEDIQVRSPNQTYNLPSVVALKSYVDHHKKMVKFTRYNVFLRDRFTCQYCRTKFATKDLTYDHVLARSRGGKTNWENVVASCVPCNAKKANFLCEEVQMIPMNKPKQPSLAFLNEKIIDPATSKHMHESWLDFLYWNIELENTPQSK